ncbi:plastocyanin/azurin family copper-binding protein [Natrarchaeobius sp. A-rgal3]|uniref:plastocyanin/azurin family copper-binding protein n=1 Tax=Natrarchaeobius versutus TaxID=1679078 RepID=UPI00350FBCFA
MGSGQCSRRSLLMTTSAAVVGWAGCLEGRPGSEDPHLGEPEPFVGVELVDDADRGYLHPPVVHAVVGGTVEWTAAGGTHDVTALHPSTHGSQRRIPEAAEPWSSGVLTAEGEPFDQGFDVEGVYDYVCAVHESRGAVGSVVVGWPDPDDQPGLEAPAKAYPDVTADGIERTNERVRDVLEEVHE